MKACHRCKTAYEELGQPGFNNTCARCGMSLHSCANCVHFVPRGSIRCLVPTAEPVLDPQAGNRCKSFEFAQSERPKEAQAQAAAVTGRSSTPPSFERTAADPAAARKRWDALFDKGS